MSDDKGQKRQALKNLRFTGLIRRWIYVFKTLPGQGGITKLIGSWNSYSCTYTAVNSLIEVEDGYSVELEAKGRCFLSTLNAL